MTCRTVVVLSLLLAAAAARADTENVRQAQSQLRFLPATAGASAGATAKAPASSDKEAMFRRLDIDGDGFVSKAEAAGNEPVTVGFDRADRNRDGKLSFAEYDSIGKPRAARKKTARKPGSASVGATKKAD
ncbi:MAG TPA: hypothetical protein VKE95_03575 [Burkholderiales bacterium]|nr:hypothetical protein [Burkholderiales bacterium]